MVLLSRIRWISGPSVAPEKHLHVMASDRVIFFGRRKRDDVQRAGAVACLAATHGSRRIVQRQLSGKTLVGPVLE